MSFKGVILAGGRGSRLSPLTDITNKFLMPVYDRLMIEYSVQSLVKAGIKEIAIVLGVKSAGETMDYLKSGKQYGCKFTYFYQDEPLGVAHALLQTQNFVAEDNVVVLCADNIIYDDLWPFMASFKGGAKITVKEFHADEQLRKFAVLDLNAINDVRRIVEKPDRPPSNIAFCGIQIYDHEVWSIIRNLRLSSRGEYEIVDVLNEYISHDRFTFELLTKPWFDCGDKDSLFAAQSYAHHNKKVNLGE